MLLLEMEQKLKLLPYLMNMEELLLLANSDSLSRLRWTLILKAAYLLLLLSLMPLPLQLEVEDDCDFLRRLLSESSCLPHSVEPGKFQDFRLV